ncbi:SRPBCC family protein [Aestuariivirga sp.]|uniref:SRPBCC family protein n=1 Tax=Aestuariivirga sp. TaxID=2650926 RepID=UPI003BACF59E
MPSTIHLYRVLPVKPDKLFRAFTDADALAAWLPPYGFTAHVEHMDAREGGTFRMSFTNFTTGHSHSFGGEFLEFVPAKRLRYTDRFDDPGLPGEMIVTVDLNEAGPGTELRVEQSGIPDVIPVAMCHLGWQDSLDKLSRLVTPDITQ